MVPAINTTHRTDKLIVKLQISKENFSKTILELLSNRANNLLDKFNKLPDLGALSMMTSNPEHYKGLFDQASNKIKGEEPQLAKIFTQISSLIDDCSFDKAEKKLKQEIFNTNLDEEEINDYLIVINRIIEEIFDKKIEYINTIKEFELKQKKASDLFYNQKEKKEIEVANQEEEIAYEKLKNAHKNLNVDPLITVLATIIMGIHLETDAVNGNIHETGVKLSEKGLTNIINIFKKHLDKQ